MGGTAALLTTSFKVGRRTVTLTIPKPESGMMACMAAEWSPDVPKRLSRKELRQYQRNRNRALSKMARDMGIRTMVVDM